MEIGAEDWDFWWDAWKNRIRCGTCRALMLVDAPCPKCGKDYRKVPPAELNVDGRLIKVPQAFQGALGWSEYSLLELMHREWLRPVFADGKASTLPPGHKPSPRVLSVLLFWTYFETLMSTFYETASAHLPRAVAEDLLKRYGTIGRRLDQLHKILFSTTYAEDLVSLGYEPVATHLRNVQIRRNAFIHGSPEEIGDGLVEETVKMGPSFHDGWIACFNHRCARQRGSNA